MIGENTIIGGNTFITESIPANTKVSAKSPELVIKKAQKSDDSYQCMGLGELMALFLMILRLGACCM